MQLEEATKIPKRRVVTKEDVGELLIKTREIITTEMVVEESQENDDIFIQEPPASHPYLFTRSQEAPFESVEMLHTQLEVHPGDIEHERSIEANDNHKGITGGDEDKQVPPLRGERTDIVNNYSAVVFMGVIIYSCSEPDYSGIV